MHLSPHSISVWHMRLEKQWAWTWQAPSRFDEAVVPVRDSAEQTSTLGALLGHLLTVTAQLTDLIPYGISCDVMKPVKAGDLLAVQLLQEPVSVSEFPQSLWFSFRATSQLSSALVVVGVVRGGLTQRH